MLKKVDLKYLWVYFKSVVLWILILELFLICGVELNFDVIVYFFIWSGELEFCSEFVL